MRSPAPPSQASQGIGLLAVVGATATGKSALAVALARRLGGEIVNADSMALYRGMDVGTAKPLPAERGGVPHHLFDIWSPEQTASVVEFQRAADAIIEVCAARRTLPILVGGSPLYVRAVLDGYAFPATDPALRALLEQDLAASGTQAMHARLARVDAAAAAAIQASNGRRVVRALEVVALSGRPYAASLPPMRYRRADTLQLGLSLERPTLERRIEARVGRMWASGLVEEVRRLEPLLRQGRTAGKAVGYAQVLDLLAGRCDEAAAKAATVRATCQLARRQDRWFTKDHRVRWLPADAPDLADRAAAMIAERLQQ